MELTMEMFKRTEPKLEKLNFDVIDVTEGTSVNITNKDSITVSKVDDRKICVKMTRELVTNPRAIFEVSATARVFLTLKDGLTAEIDSTNLIEFVEKHKNELCITGFIRLSNLLSNVTSNFGDLPIVTPPAPANNIEVGIEK